jgi:hypothetical protein
MAFRKLTGKAERYFRRRSRASGKESRNEEKDTKKNGQDNLSHQTHSFQK